MTIINSPTNKAISVKPNPTGGVEILISIELQQIIKNIVLSVITPIKNKDLNKVAERTCYHDNLEEEYLSHPNPEDENSKMLNEIFLNLRLKQLESSMITLLTAMKDGILNDGRNFNMLNYCTSLQAYEAALLLRILKLLDSGDIERAHLIPDEQKNELNEFKFQLDKMSKLFQNEFDSISVLV